jgi:hypothetical protein
MCLVCPLVSVVRDYSCFASALEKAHSITEHQNALAACTNTHTHRRTQTHTSTHCHFFHRPSPFKYSFGSSSYSTLGVFAYKRLRSYISLHFHPITERKAPKRRFVSISGALPHPRHPRPPPATADIYLLPTFFPQLTSLLLSTALRSKTARESCGPDQALAPLLIVLPRASLRRACGRGGCGTFPCPHVVFYTLRPSNPC